MLHSKVATFELRNFSQACQGFCFTSTFILSKTQTPGVRLLAVIGSESDSSSSDECARLVENFDGELQCKAVLHSMNATCLHISAVQFAGGRHIWCPYIWDSVTPWHCLALIASHQAKRTLNS